MEVAGGEAEEAMKRLAQLLHQVESGAAQRQEHAALTVEMEGWLHTCYALDANLVTSTADQHEAAGEELEGG